MKHNPADLPDYRHPDYDRMAPILQLLIDSYTGLEDTKDRYLEKAQLEPEPRYRQRVKAAVFNNKLAPMINSNAGLLTAFDAVGLPATLESSTDNVDGHGSDLKSFLYKANIAALRDLSVFVLTMMAPSDRPRTRADELIAPRVPHWQLIDRRNILNWRVAYVADTPVIQQVTILMWETLADGRYGVRMEERYHVLSLAETGGVLHEVFKIEQIDGERMAIATQEPQIYPIPRIPLTAYFDNTNPFSTKIPEFTKAARLNIKLFRQESTLDSIQYRANAPTPWRRSRLPLSREEADRLGMEPRPPFALGENVVIELMASDGTYGPDEVGILEVSGQSIAALQKGIEETKRDIEAEGLGFLSGSQVQRTATETYISSAQVSASLNGKARQMQSALKRMVADWCLFTGEDPAEFEIQMDQSLLEMPLDAQEMGQLLALWQASVIDHQTLLELLRMGRQLPSSADIKEIMRRVEKENQAPPRDPSPDLPIVLPQPQPQPPTP